MKSFTAVITFDPRYWNVSNGRDSSECRDVVLGRRGLLEKLLTRWTDKETRAWQALQGEKSKAVGQRGAVLTAF